MVACSNDKPAKYVRAFFDGSRRPGAAAFGWVAFGTEAVQSDNLVEWQLIASKSQVLCSEASITAAELEAASSVVKFLLAYYASHDTASRAIQAMSEMDYSVIRKFSLAALI